MWILRFDTLHDTLNGGLTEVVRVRFHGQTVYANHHVVFLAGVISLVCFVCTSNFQHTVSNIILASAIRFHNCFNEVLRNISIVSQQLLGVLGQTVSTITEAGVVVVACQCEVDRGFSRSGRFYADDFGTAHYCSGSMTLAVKKSSSME